MAAGTSHPQATSICWSFATRRYVRVLRDRDVRLAYAGTIPLDIVVVTLAEYRDLLPTTSMGRTILRDARRLDAV